MPSCLFIRLDTTGDGCLTRARAVPLAAGVLAEGERLPCTTHALSSAHMVFYLCKELLNKRPVRVCAG